MTDWLRRAACTEQDPELFFPASESSAERHRIREACAVCAHCPVSRECLDFAQTTHQRHGIWGGTTPRQRARRRLREPALTSAEDTALTRSILRELMR